MIKYYGYVAETHKIVTEDGYILTAFRCISKEKVTTKKQPLLAVHGITLSSDDFSINNQSQALGSSQIAMIKINKIMFRFWFDI